MLINEILKKTDSWAKTQDIFIVRRFAKIDSDFQKWQVSLNTLFTLKGIINSTQFITIQSQFISDSTLFLTEVSTFIEKLESWEITADRDLANRIQKAKSIVGYIDTKLNTLELAR